MLSETAALGWSALLIIINILAQVTLATPQLGIPYLNSPRDERLQLKGVAARMERATINGTIGYALYAPAVLLVITSGGSTSQTLLAANLYLWARIAYFILYAAGIHYLRTAVWLVGVGTTVWLWLMVI